jgi:hypothetical protein
VTGIECAALLVMAGVEFASLDSRRLQVGVTTAIFFVVYAAGLGAAGWGIARLHSWARSPLVLTQAIQLGLAWSFVGSGTSWVAAVLAVLAAFVLVAVLMPTTTQALYGPRGSR